jgi:DNA-binding IclR family transcriptional regulator
MGRWCVKVLCGVADGVFMSQAVERALEILEQVAERPMRIGELAVCLGVHESTAFRLVRTLEARHLVFREPDRRFRLGARIFALAHQALEVLDIREVARPHLTRLRDAIDCTVHLGQFEDDEVLYIDKFEGLTSVRMYSRIGKQAPLHCTGVAKAIVAYLPASERVSLANRINYRIFTESTITGPERYLEELRLVRERGFAVDAGEHEPSIVCVAAPIYEADGQVRHSVSMSVPASEIRLADLVALVPTLLAATHAISSELGWPRPMAPAVAAPLGSMTASEELVEV